MAAQLFPFQILASLEDAQANFEYLQGKSTPFLQRTANLSDVASAATARTNLGLGSAAVQNSTAFLQLPVARSMLCVAGYIDGRAATFGIVSGTDFVASRSATGRYTITFNTAFGRTPAVMFATNGVSGVTVAFFTSISTSVLGVAIDNLSSVAQDDLFTFIAIG